MDKKSFFEFRSTSISVDGEFVEVSAGIINKRGKDALFSEPSLYGSVSFYLDGELIGQVSANESKLLKAFINQQRAIYRELSEWGALTSEGLA